MDNFVFTWSHLTKLIFFFNKQDCREQLHSKEIDTQQNPTQTTNKVD